MKSTLLTQETKPFTKADRLQIVQTHDSAYEQKQELTAECPDCFDTMIKMYDSYKIRYHCENCDLLIGDIGAQVFDE